MLECWRSGLGFQQHLSAAPGDGRVEVEPDVGQHRHGRGDPDEPDAPPEPGGRDQDRIAHQQRRHEADERVALEQGLFHLLEELDLE